ncbi:hypothetical protein M2283_001050 [Streptomyces pseudovenezuelae]|uniref:Uncharacterized protein n=1 Tax=Streptomyces pseudovenezuelae TaxID=67350 RepID=A0ABT6LBU2_9ACTN|nr:hypothetical protein [Streptomyces pseudovenezuelae]
MAPAGIRCRPQAFDGRSATPVTAGARDRERPVTAAGVRRAARVRCRVAGTDGEGSDARHGQWYSVSPIRLPAQSTSVTRSGRAVAEQGGEGQGDAGRGRGTRGAGPGHVPEGRGGPGPGDRRGQIRLRRAAAHRGRARRTVRRLPGYGPPGDGHAADRGAHRLAARYPAGRDRGAPAAKLRRTAQLHPLGPFDGRGTRRPDRRHGHPARRPDRTCPTAPAGGSRGLPSTTAAYVVGPPGDAGAHRLPACRW